VDLRSGRFRTVNNKAEQRIEPADTTQISYTGNWLTDSSGQQVSDERDASFRIRFKGSGIAMYGLMRPDGGYAKILLQNNKGEKVLDAIIDTYCSYPASGLRFRTPNLKRDHYTLTVTVMQERGNWSDKRKSLYGSTGYKISLEKLVVNP